MTSAPPSPQSAVGSDSERRAQLVLEIAVTRLDASIDFYTALGFTLARRAGGFASLSFGGAWLFLAEEAPQPRAEHNLRVLVHDVDAAWQTARALGAEIARPIGDRDYGLRDFTLRDPDGFCVRFASVIDRQTSGERDHQTRSSEDRAQR
ncbi:MAG: VOC family protein [Labilithrix sp.]|nr:VOC family protein [Labilithrix sp.]